MIDGEPRVGERDGKPVIVDAAGDVVVCRCGSTHPSGNGRHYHHVDIDRFERTGTIKPACGDIASHRNVSWKPRHKADLDGIWDGCSYRACFGKYDPSDPKSKISGYSGLAATLANMSVEEFGAAVEPTQTALRAGNGGER